jgi:prepilin-type N-terminal cleavage/methylation domain-containing protein
MYHRNARSGRSSEDGFSLIEVMVTLAVIVIAGVLLFNGFTFNKSKGQIMYSLAGSIAGAAKRMEVDTSCYPLNTAQLFNYKSYGGTTNTCGENLGSVWNGPYSNAYSTLTANDNIILNQLGQNVDARIIKAANTITTSSEANMIAVQFNNVPNGIASQAGIACGIPQTNGNTLGDTGNNCIVGAANAVGTGTTTFTYVFAFSNT